MTPLKQSLWPSTALAPLGTIDRVSEAHRLTTPTLGALNHDDVYFRTAVVDFGYVEMNQLVRERVDLCNGTNRDLDIEIRDPDLPFVILHEKITVKARSFISVPIRFVPVAIRNYSSELLARSNEGHYLHCTLFRCSDANTANCSFV